jgi:outer membrane lipoprotein carrier protein
MVTAMAATLLSVWLAAGWDAAPASAGEEPEPAPAGASAPAAPPQASAPQASGASCLDRAVDALQNRYERVSDLRARFVQTTRPAHMGGIAPEPVTSRGSMVVAKPARMRWVYEAPEQSVVVSDGESLWIYDASFQEAQRLPVGEGYLSGAAVQFLLGEGDLRRDFEIALVGCDEESAELSLTPREPATYEKLRVVVDPRSGALSRTRVEDLLGNVTIVELSDLETNLNPDPAVFRFVAPEGVSVIELQTPQERAQ